MTRRLTAHRTLALQASLAQQPQVALLALTHRLVLRELYEPGTGGRSPLQVRTEPVSPRQDAPDLDQARAYAVLHEHRAKLRAQLPAADGLFEWLSGQGTETVLQLLAFCVAQTVNGVQSDDTPGAIDELAAAAHLDMREWWTPTAAGYFTSLPKAEILMVVRDATSAEVARPLEFLKKVNLADLCVCRRAYLRLSTRVEFSRPAAIVLPRFAAECDSDIAQLIAVTCGVGNRTRSRHRRWVIWPATIREDYDG